MVGLGRIQPAHKGVSVMTDIDDDILYTMDTVLCLFTRVRHPKLCSVRAGSLSMYSSSGVSGGEEMRFGESCR